MRALAGTFALCFALGGCSVITERSTLGYGDYVTMNCDQLGQEAVHLMRETTDGNQLLENGRTKRENAILQLRAVKQARADKHC